MSLDALLIDGEDDASVPSDIMSSLDSDTEADLRQLLNCNFKNSSYVDYVDCVLMIVEEKGE